MQVDLFVVRHEASGARTSSPSMPHRRAILNAGDGRQLTLRRGCSICSRSPLQKGFPQIALPSSHILHSRVARSDIHGLRTLGAKEIRVVAPPTLIPPGIEQMGATCSISRCGLRDVDVVILLRLQKERMLAPSFRAWASSTAISA